VSARPRRAGAKASRGGAPARRRIGKFVVLEGLDGAGTTTQARLLGDRLRKEGRKVHVTAEPSGGPVGALLRQVLTRRIGGGAAGQGSFSAAALALLFAADRLDHFEVDIAPKLVDGVDVVCDRFTMSSLAYQGAHLRDMGWVATINRAAAGTSLVVFLRVRPEVALRRRQAASIDPEIFEVDAFQREVARSYEGAIRRLRRAGETIVEVDGEAPVEAVSAAVWDAVRRLR
jgi:dTMP kinase